MVRTLCACSQTVKNQPAAEVDARFELVRRSGETGIYRCCLCSQMFVFSDQGWFPLEVTHYPSQAVIS
ncbi:hypothetical protein [Neptuniibacter halophilus]|uniref:hypothetical protein n=1 Tax=Neptuniibacter halophilus TaxID=651666 RepID=UPI002573E454|nr:hypothetical protein [Neptuniibacter halophilus]